MQKPWSLVNHKMHISGYLHFESKKKNILLLFTTLFTCNPQPLLKFLSAFTEVWSTSFLTQCDICWHCCLLYRRKKNFFLWHIFGRLVNDNRIDISEWKYLWIYCKTNVYFILVMLHWTMPSAKSLKRESEKKKKSHECKFNLYL